MNIYLIQHNKRVKIGILVYLRDGMYGIFNSKYKAINYMKFEKLIEVAELLVNCYDMPDNFSLEIVD